ncbi:MAG: glycosyltransferase family 4 protein [Desulfuromonadales bacterium]|nr:glycosyltransferase family 4 protein [Desulfuromonadales bacterium]
MKIAQIAPLYESVPPRFYGGTERVVSHLTEELVALGHEVTLFASGDSVTTARLCATRERSLRLDGACVDTFPHHFVHLENVFRQAEQFDILHFHVDYLHYPWSRRAGRPHVTTLHGRLDIPDLIPLYREYAELPLVSISHDQRRPLPSANWVGTVHHGLPTDIYPFHPEPGSYLAFLGRISPEKRVDRAIEIAIGAGLPLKIAAKVDRADRDYFATTIQPLLDHPLVEFIGEIGEAQKAEFLGQALALLFPIDWQEPFGLVMIEAMACGTPVIAWPLGSVPEVMTDGISGFVVSNIEEAVRAVDKVTRLDRKTCRRYFEQRFSVRRMALDYLAVYQSIYGSSSGRPARLVAN